MTSSYLHELRCPLPRGYLPPRPLNLRSRRVPQPKLITSEIYGRKQHGIWSHLKETYERKDWVLHGPRQSLSLRSSRLVTKLLIRGVSPGDVLYVINIVESLAWV
jgi:hypothetical protein